MRVAGVGPALVDYLHLIDVYPDRGGHTVVKNTRKMAGGAAANVIFGLTLYGFKGSFYSPVGDDEDGKFFIDSFRKIGVNTEGIQVISGSTGRVECFVDGNGERTFFVFPGVVARLDEYRIPLEKLEREDVIYLDPFPVEKSFEFHFRVAEECSSSKVLNPGFPYTRLGFKKLRSLLALCDVVILNKDEFNLLGVPPSDYLKTGVTILIVTLGKDGSVAYVDSASPNRIKSPSVSVEVVDTTGAGDAFSVGFLYGYLNDLPIRQSLDLGNTLAAHCITGLGARNFMSKEEFESVVEGLEF
jgi:ribokinase